MTHYILVKVETEGVDDAVVADIALTSEILTNLESIRDDYAFDITTVKVVSVPRLGPDLLTLNTAAGNATEAMECSAALNNYSGYLLGLLGEFPVDSCAPLCASRVPFGECTCGRVDADDETNLDYFNLTLGGLPQ